jgi:hypothetical protein
VAVAKAALPEDVNAPSGSDSGEAA